MPNKPRERALTKSTLRRSCAFIALGAGVFAAPAWAQVGTVDNAPVAQPEPQLPQDGVGNDPVTEAESGREIVVTGTLIRGSSEQAPVPIDVISSDELAKQ